VINWKQQPGLTSTSPHMNVWDIGYTHFGMLKLLYINQIASISVQ